MTEVLIVTSIPETCSLQRADVNTFMSIANKQVCSLLLPALSP